MSAKKETTFLRTKVYPFLTENEWEFTKNHGSVFSEAGTSDIYALKNGLSVFIEAKTDDNIPTDKQFSFLNRFIKNGALGIWFSNEFQMKMIFKVIEDYLEFLDTAPCNKYYYFENGIFKFNPESFFASVIAGRILSVCPVCPSPVNIYDAFKTNSYKEIHYCSLCGIPAIGFSSKHSFFEVFLAKKANNASIGNNIPKITAS